MADIKSPEARSRNMAKIRSKDTKPEVWFRKQLFSYGFRYRKNVSTIPGHPDIWLAKHNTAVFVHGCFWHRHKECKYAYIPKSNVDFWINKFQKNIERDKIVQEQLTMLGIRNVIIWECSIKKAMASAEKALILIEDFHEFLVSDKKSVEL